MRELLTVNELAALLKVHPKTVRAWVKQGKIPVIKMPGRGVRFDQDKIEKWIETRTIRQRNIGQ